MQTDSLALYGLIAAVAVVLAVAILIATQRRRQRSAALREHFGSEYDRALAEHGGQARAEKELLARQKRFQGLDIKLLSPVQCERFSVAWAAVQHRFVDDPSGAVLEADRLVKEVMQTRGYPVGNFEQRVADLSVEHTHVLDHYRAARDIAHQTSKGESGTEEQRQAMVHYRALFNDLLQARAVYADSASSPAQDVREAHA